MIYNIADVISERENKEKKFTEGLNNWGVKLARREFPTKDVKSKQKARPNVRPILRFPMKEEIDFFPFYHPLLFLDISSHFKSFEYIFF